MARDYVSMMGSPQGGLIGNLMRGVAQGHQTQVARHKANMDRAQLALMAAQLQFQKNKAQQDHLDKMTALKSRNANVKAQLDFEQDRAIANIKQRQLSDAKASRRLEAELTFKAKAMEVENAQEMARARATDEYRQQTLEEQRKANTEKQIANLKRERTATLEAESRARLREAQIKQVEASTRMGGRGKLPSTALSGSTWQAIGDRFAGEAIGDKASLQYFDKPPVKASASWKQKYAEGTRLRRYVEDQVADMGRKYNDPVFNPQMEMFDQHGATMYLTDRLIDEMRNQGVLTPEGTIKSKEFTNFMEKLKDRDGTL